MLEGMPQPQRHYNTRRRSWVQVMALTARAEDLKDVIGQAGSLTGFSSVVTRSRVSRGYAARSLLFFSKQI